MQSYFVFREAKNTDELEALLRLRYQVYQDCRMKVFFSKNNNGIDLDCYDLKARHFGLFKDGKQPIGYMRVVEDEDSPMKKEVLYLASKFPYIAEAIQTPSEYPFPLMNYSAKANQSVQPLLDRRAAGQRLVEAGRFALDPAFQSRKLGQHMIESAIAVIFNFKVDCVIIACHRLHRAIYSRYGFRGVSLGEHVDVYSLPFCILFASPKDVPARVRPRIESMAADFQKTGEICYPAHSRVSASTNAIRTPQHRALRVAA